MCRHHRDTYHRTVFQRRVHNALSIIAATVLYAALAYVVWEVTAGPGLTWRSPVFVLPWLVILIIARREAVTAQGLAEVTHEHALMCHDCR